MHRAAFEQLIAQGFDQLPEWVRKKISNVAVLVEDEPSQEDREAEGLSEDETLLGLYKGIPLSARGENYGVGMTLPDTITLYQLPIEEAAEEDGLPVSQVIAETIWHEFAHHFGMNEREVRNREKGQPGFLGYEIFLLKNFSATAPSCDRAPKNLAALPRSCGIFPSWQNFPKR